MEDNIAAVIRKMIREEIVAVLKQPLSVQPESPLRHYSVKSAAALLDTSEDYVLARIKDGSLPRVVDLGGSRARYRIPIQALREFIDSRAIR
ncbi:helix-turn-helix domain-containing protein [Leucobacter chromiiresistens]|uniref:helix-turn-helix domain-containing protein n=1 Tax=Leucobacter chromiiresistens TaxID=1079994 RepID=UPI000262A0C9|nr:helix-turn-helix domain-containing protein [Leucobacter chromiiresistens]